MDTKKMPLNAKKLLEYWREHKRRGQDTKKIALSLGMSTTKFKKLLKMAKAMEKLDQENKPDLEQLNKE